MEKDYQAPELIEIGTFEEMTLGSKYDDTADKNAHRY
ncbi:MULTISPECIES: lasso RiPP family leader peptide-containing protein [Shimazuella]|uniref:Lasso RiPP family leader peptide-containing protein n=1 Tax=Shimazuella alba TaxID=2690964 RepID=A0A6I4W4Q5_9BACL|nr:MULTISPECIES: lasso RiPP family leader peptide-containing protein [Shimazuella]MXQ55282.1 lasso RiPP family leader peptide-containing protein [Shimazuella alba]